GARAGWAVPSGLACAAGGAGRPAGRSPRPGNFACRGHPPAASTRRPVMGSHIELTAADGHRFAAYVAEPGDAARGAIVIAPEIFGINAHIRAVADDYAAEGFFAIAPALFDRVQRDFETGYDPDDIRVVIGLMNRIDIADAIAGASAAGESDSSAGRVGLVGYCWGGTIAWVGAARIEGLSASVAYYGGGIPRFA